jgi:hypothetical protein
LKLVLIPLVGDHALIKVCIAEYWSHKNFFKINKARLIKLTWSGYLQSKSASSKLLGRVDFGWFASCMLNGEERVLHQGEPSSTEIQLMSRLK